MIPSVLQVETGRKPQRSCDYSCPSVCAQLPILHTNTSESCHVTVCDYENILFDNYSDSGWAEIDLLTACVASQTGVTACMMGSCSKLTSSWYWQLTSDWGVLQGVQ